jgi:WD40 repeat protein
VERSSSGGLGPVRGSEFEARVLAWLSCHLLAHRELPKEWVALGQVSAIGGQTARLVDDVGALTGRGGHLLIQCKQGLRLGGTPTSALGKAISQVVAQYLRGIPDSPDDDRRRRLSDPSRDRLIVVTDEGAPASSRTSLVKAVDGLAYLPPELPFTDVGGNTGIVSARDVVLGHLRREWAAQAGGPPGGVELRALLRVLRVRAVCLDEDRPDWNHALGLLETVLEDPTRSRGAWEVLVSRSLTRAGKKQWARREDLAEELAHSGFALRPEYERSVPLSMAPALPLAFVERPAIASRLARALTRGQNTGIVVLTGPSGFGKSTLAAWACQQASVREHFPDGVLWVELGQRRGLDQHIVSILTDLVTLLNGTRTIYETVQAASEALTAALGDRRILLVIDGAWRAQDAQWFLGGGTRCVRLITTQRRLPINADEIPVELLTTAEAGTLLGHALSALSASDLTPLLDRAKGSPLVLAMLNVLLRDLHGLPLDSVVADLAARLDRRGVTMLDELADRHGDRTAGQAFAVALEELAATAPDGQRALDRYASLTGFPAGETIPYSLLAPLWGQDQIEVRARCGQLLNRSLVAAAEDGVRLHDIFHNLLRDRYPGHAAQASRQLLDATRPTAGWHALAGPVRTDLGNQLAFHLIQGRRVAELRALLRDLRYLVARIRGDGLVALEEDVKAYTDAAGDSDEPARELLRYLRRNAHLLHGSGTAEPDLTLALYSRIVGRFPVEHAQDALPERGLVPEQPLPDLAGSRLTRAVRCHRGQVSAVAWQTGGLLMSVGGDDGLLRRWHPHSGALASETAVCEDLVLTASLSPDGSHLALLVHPRPSSRSAWATGTILRFQVVSTATGEPVAGEYVSVGDFIDGSKRAVAWSPDSAVLALPCTDEIRFWSPLGAQSTRPLPFPRGGVRALSWHPARGLACLTYYGLVVVWPDPIASDSHTELMVFDDEDYPRALAWSPDGTRIIVAADRNLVNIEADQRGMLRLSEGGGVPGLGCPAAIAWRPDSRAFAVASNHAGIPVHGSMITVWGAEPGGAPDTDSLIDMRYAGILDLAWQPDGGYLAAAYTDSTLRLWHPALESAGGAADGGHEGAADWADRTMHPAYRALKAAGQDENAHNLIRDLPESGVLVTCYGDAAHEQATHTAKPDAPDRWLLPLNHADTGIVTAAEWDAGWVYSSTQACQDFGLPAMAAVHTFGFNDVHLTLRRGAKPAGDIAKSVVWQTPRCLAVDPAGAYLAAASETGHITLLDLQTLDHVCEIRIDEAAQACAFDPHGAQLAVAGLKGIYLFRVSRQKIA